MLHLVLVVATPVALVAVQTVLHVLGHGLFAPVRGASADPTGGWWRDADGRIHEPIRRP